MTPVSHANGPYAVHLAANRVVTLVHGVPQSDTPYRSEADALEAYNAAVDLVDRIAAERPGTLSAEDKLRLRAWQDGCAEHEPGAEDLPPGFRSGYVRPRVAEVETPVFRLAAE